MICGGRGAAGGVAAGCGGAASRVAAKFLERPARRREGPVQLGADVAAFVLHWHPRFSRLALVPLRPDRARRLLASTWTRATL